MRNRRTLLRTYGPALGPGLIYLAVLLAAVLIRGLSLLVPGSVLLMSGITFAAYAWDKRRAVTGGWRTREATLHVMEAMGGWPGGLAAQRVLRHKNRKRSYQMVFWLIAVLNAGVTLLLVMRVN